MKKNKSFENFFELRCSSVFHLQDNALSTESVPMHLTALAAHKMASVVVAKTFALVEDLMMGDPSDEYWTVQEKQVRNLWQPMLKTGSCISTLCTYSKIVRSQWWIHTINKMQTGASLGCKETHNISSSKYAWTKLPQPEITSHMITHVDCSRHARLSAQIVSHVWRNANCWLSFQFLELATSLSRMYSLLARILVAATSSAGYTACTESAMHLSLLSAYFLPPGMS